MYLKIIISLLYIFCIIFTLLVICMIKNLHLSITIQKTSSMVLFRNAKILLVPFISLILILLYVYLWFYSLGYLISCGNIHQPEEVNSQTKSFDLYGRTGLKFLIAFFVFGFLWILEMMYTVFQYVIIVGIDQKVALFFSVSLTVFHIKI